MKDFIVAGILGTMLAFTKCAPASAHDRFENYRPSVHYNGRYADRDCVSPYRGHDFNRYTSLDRRDFCDALGCDTGIRYPWPTHQGNDRYRPYSSAYSYNIDLYRNPRLTYGYR
jgi:hypothetical protein